MTFSVKYNAVLNEHVNVIKSLRQEKNMEIDLTAVANEIVNAYLNGNKLLICGNGGSAADAQHIATELVSRFFLERKALDAEALNINTSSLTAISNDYSFEQVFSRQVEAKAKSSDVLIGITTSGISKNILAAFEAGKKAGTKNVCFTGGSAPSSLDQLCDIVIRVPSTCTPRIQEVHIIFGHILCEYIEERLFNFKK